MRRMGEQAVTLAMRRRKKTKTVLTPARARGSSPAIAWCRNAFGIAPQTDGHTHTHTQTLISTRLTTCFICLNQRAPLTLPITPIELVGDHHHHHHDQKRSHGTFTIVRLIGGKKRAREQDAPIISILTSIPLPPNPLPISPRVEINPLFFVPCACCLIFHSVCCFISFFALAFSPFHSLSQSQRPKRPEGIPMPTKPSPPTPKPLLVMMMLLLLLLMMMATVWRRPFRRRRLATARRRRAKENVCDHFRPTRHPFLPRHTTGLPPFILPAQPNTVITCRVLLCFCFFLQLNFFLLSRNFTRLDDGLDRPTQADRPTNLASHATGLSLSLSPSAPPLHSSSSSARPVSPVFVPCAVLGNWRLLPRGRPPDIITILLLCAVILSF